MQVARKLRSFKSKDLPPGCVLPQLKSVLLDQATRDAGRTLYELLGMAELMRVAYEKGELQVLHQRLASLLSDAAGLSNRLSHIIELAHLEMDAEKPLIEEIDLTAFLQEAARNARSIAGRKPVTIMDAAAPGPLLIRSDPHKVRRIVAELVNNAAKFTERGRITLILSEDGEGVRLMVADTGKGMSAEEIAVHFYANEREFDGETSPGSVGLGLKIVRRLVKSLRGTISASSKAGEGTIVEVFLPVARVSQKKTGVFRGQAAPAGKNTANVAI